MLKQPIPKLNENYQNLKHSYLFSEIAHRISAYARNGVTVAPNDIFISDGAKSETDSISELFASDNVIFIPDPVYLVYVFFGSIHSPYIWFECPNGMESLSKI